MGTWCGFINPEYDTYSFVQCPTRAKIVAAAGDEIPQAAPLTSDFSPPAWCLRQQPASNCKVRAAADKSWWIIDPTLPDTLTRSVLCTSSGHTATIAVKTKMIQHLVALGHSPNILPVAAAPTRCFPTLTVPIHVLYFATTSSHSFDTLYTPLEAAGTSTRPHSH
jgi:hypothetical protein